MIFINSPTAAEVVNFRPHAAVKPAAGGSQIHKSAIRYREQLVAK